MNTPQQPDTGNFLNARSDVPFTRIQLDTLTLWQRSRIIGAIIINRHSRNGTFDKLSAGAIRMLMSMTNIFGVAVDNCAGLVVRRQDLEKDFALRARLGRAVGLGEQSNYVPIRDLLSEGIIQLVRLGGRNGDDFVLNIPHEPFCGSPENEALEPLLDNQPDNPAMLDARANALQQPNLPLLDNSPDNPAMLDARARVDRDFVKSDFDVPIGDARASSNADPNSLAKLSSLAFSFIARAELKRGRMTIADALKKAGMRPGHAISLAKHPNATIDQVCGGIRKCELKEENEEKVNREALITSHVKNKWGNPPLEHEEQVNKLNLPEHEQEMVATYIQAERSSNGGAAATLHEPAADPKLKSLISELVAAAPNAERDAEAARTAAAGSRQKMLLAGRREEETIAHNRRVLTALGPDKLNALVDAAIATAPNDFMRDRFIANRAAPLEYKSLIVAMVQVLTTGGQQ